MKKLGRYFREWTIYTKNVKKYQLFAKCRCMLSVAVEFMQYTCHETITGLSSISLIAEHQVDTCHKILFENITVLWRSSHYYNRKIRISSNNPIML